MDIVTAAGTRFYISSDQVAETFEGFRSISDWVELGNVETIAEFGEESEDIVRIAFGQERLEHLKGLRGPVGLNIVVGHDVLDDGQDAFDIAEGVAIQFAFKIAIPISDEVNDIIYFQALVRSSTWAVGSNDNVVRRNYACTLNSEIFTVTEISSSIAASFQGAGSLIASLKMRIGVSATYAGAGSLTAPISLRQGVSASFQGAGSLAADIIVGAFVGNTWAVSANFAGAGNLNASLRQQNKVAANFQGAGLLAANVTVITNFVLLRDGVSKLLLRDGISRLRLGH